MLPALPDGLVMVLFLLAVAVPIARARWPQRTGWLRLLPRQWRVRFTLLLSAVAQAEAERWR